jgi:protein-disulfide isomerase
MSRRTFAAGGVSLAALTGVAHAAGLTSDDVTIGAADAPLHLIEYASATCPHCAAFHAAAWDALRSQYIERGRLRFTFREMATPPAPVALAMFQLARCETVDPGEYFRRVAHLFERQRAILSTGSGAGVRDALLALGAEWGLSAEQVMACLNDPAGAERIMRSMEQAGTLGIHSTPSFILNGARVEDMSFHTLEGMARILDARLAAD